MSGLDEIVPIRLDMSLLWFYFIVVHYDYKYVKYVPQITANYSITQIIGECQSFDPLEGNNQRP